MARSPIATTVLALGLSTLLGLNYAGARRQFDSASKSLTDEREDESLRLPSSGAMTALFAGFETMAADVAWIACAVHYGPMDASDPRPRRIHDNAQVVVELDPYFYDVYGWYSGFTGQTLDPVSLADVEKVNGLLDRGIENFPDDFWLPFDAGMNYLGGVDYENPAEKLRAYECAIEFLEQASRRGGGPEYVPLTVAHLHEEVLQLRENVEADSERESTASYEQQHADFLAEMYYLVDDPGVRNSLEAELKETQAGREALQELGREYADRLRRRHSESFAYLPAPVWAHVAPLDR